MLVERPAPLSALPAGPTFALMIDAAPAPATYEGCITLRAVPTDACRAAHGLRADEEAYDDAMDAIRAAYRAEGRRTGQGHVTEGRYGARCNVTYIGTYRLWMWDPRPFPFAAEVCQ